MAAPAHAPLLPARAEESQAKRQSPFGYWPRWSECVPLLEDGAGRSAAQVDAAQLIANVSAGLVIGVRQGLSAVMTASLVFSSTGAPELVDMMSFGISMMWFSSTVSALWYGLFGRLQYGLIGINDVIGALYATMLLETHTVLKGRPAAEIQATALAVIAASTVLTGVGSILFGRLGLGNYMLQFPAPVTSGFLGSVGFFIFRTSLQTSSGVKFFYFYPSSWEAFLQKDSAGRIACMLAMVVSMRWGPGALRHLLPRSNVAKKLGGIICQLAPLALFYAAVAALGVGMEDLANTGWTYPPQGAGGALDLWTRYPMREADPSAVLARLPDMAIVVLMSVLCTMTGLLGIAGKFPQGPPGDPAPLDTVNFDSELATVGWCDILLGATGGVVVFHRLGSTVQLRLDGGTHRVSLLVCGLFCAGLLFSGLPIGHLVPKWFLGGLFMNSSLSFLQDALLLYRKLPEGSKLGPLRLPSAQYAVTLSCMVISVFSSPTVGIGAGLVLSVFLFIWQSSMVQPVSSLSLGSRGQSRTKRPIWELRVLRREGDRIVLLFLQGSLFFGSTNKLADAISAAIQGESDGETGRVRYCLLSFARVPHIDASAAEQLRSEVKRAKMRGCEVICCRMRGDVFESLWAAGVVSAPDRELRKVLASRGIQPMVGASTTSSSIGSPPPQGQCGLDDEETRELTRELTRQEVDSQTSEAPLLRPLRRSRTTVFKPLGSGSHDAFDTEADALDWCSGKLLEEFCYAGGLQVEAHMLAYRDCCVRGSRLNDQDFEAICGLPAGSMARLKPYCEVRDRVCTHERLTEHEPTLYFVLRGGVTTFETIQEDSMMTSLAAELCAEVKGFAGRRGQNLGSAGGQGGKRLRKRYPPGSIVSCSAFFLQLRGKLVDDSLLPQLEASSRYSSHIEVWLLQRRGWEELPADLRQVLLEACLLAVADDRQHDLLV